MASDATYNSMFATLTKMFPSTVTGIAVQKVCPSLGTTTRKQTVPEDEAGVEEVVNDPKLGDNFINVMNGPSEGLGKFGRLMAANEEEKAGSQLVEILQKELPPVGDALTRQGGGSSTDHNWTGVQVTMIKKIHDTWRCQFDTPAGEEQELADKVSQSLNDVHNAQKADERVAKLEKRREKEKLKKKKKLQKDKKAEVGKKIFNGAKKSKKTKRTGYHHDPPYRPPVNALPATDRPLGLIKMLG